MPTKTLTTNELSSRLRQTVARLQRILRQQAMGGLNLTQISCLATIGREGPLPLGEVSTRENLSAPFVTKIVTKLEDLGLVKRTTVPGDRRVSLVSTTPAGSALLEEVRTRRTAYLNRRLSRLDPAEIEALIAALPILELLATEDEPTR